MSTMSDLPGLSAGYNRAQTKAATRMNSNNADHIRMNEYYKGVSNSMSKHNKMLLGIGIVVIIAIIIMIYFYMKKKAPMYYYF